MKYSDVNPKTSAADSIRQTEVNEFKTRKKD